MTKRDPRSGEVLAPPEDKTGLSSSMIDGAQRDITTQLSPWTDKKLGQPTPKMTYWKGILDFGSPEKPISYPCPTADQFGNGIMVIMQGGQASHELLRSLGVISPLPAGDDRMGGEGHQDCTP